MNRQDRGARIVLRVDSETKALVERAARAVGRRLTDFCVTALTEAARDANERNGAIVLSANDRAAFFDALVRPPNPNARLRRALREERVRIAT